MNPPLPNQIRSTAGAVPVLNKKGELTMQKVKVTRYVSGRRPDYAQSESESESSEEEEGFAPVGGEEEEELGEGLPEEEPADEVPVDVQDRRLQRLRGIQGARVAAGRHARDIEEPEVIYESSDDDDGAPLPPVHLLVPSSDSESEEEELNDETIERRRATMRDRARRKAMDEDVLDLVEEEDKSESDSSSEYEEYSDSEDETGPRLKPVFVPRVDRLSIKEKEAQAKQEKEIEQEKKRQAELRKRESHRMVAQVVDQEKAAEQGAESLDKMVDTDDENDELEYEAWKLRELKRIKRDREEREKLEKEREEIERMHNMTEEERRAALRAMPKVITNKQEKGKYKFLQKYYHRGVFYLDEEDTTLRRDFAQPTLEDHFDKTILPKVMQVKDFGRAGRTKYTHLVDQDTTEFESPWVQTTPINLKFQNKGGGNKQYFVKPSHKKRKIGQ